MITQITDLSQFFLFYLDCSKSWFIISNQLYEYLDENKHLFSHQSGFRSLHSVVTSLLNSTNDWYVNIDNGKYTAMVFIDLKKAFDMVNHQILLAKLKKYGIDGLEYLWFQSYLETDVSSVG